MSTRMARAAAESRRYDLDWLRVLAFTGVFFYHSARFFNSNDWHIKNAETSALVDAITGIFELWGMPLIFAISGASIFFALRPGGAMRFLRERALRLLAPLAFGILVLAPPQIYLERLTHGDFQGTFWQFLPRFFDGDFAWTGVHLWYLEYLFLFTLVLLPLFVWLKRPAGQRAIESLSRFSARPGAIFLWVLPLALVTALADPFSLLRPAPSEAIVRLILYPLPLIYGFLIFSDNAIQQAIIRQRRATLALALVSSPAPLLARLGVEEWGWQLGLPGFVLLMTLAMLLVWSYILAILGYGLRYLNANPPQLTYANEAVLPFYILHQPVILLIGYFVIPLALPIALKYAIIAPLAFGATLGLYEVGIRRWNLARRVFGLKAREHERRLSAMPDIQPLS